MSHFSDEITEILTRHGMEHEPLPDDWEEEDFDLLSVFCLLGDQYLLFSVDVTEPGGCGESLEEFCCSFVNQIVDGSGGKFNISNLTSESVNDGGEEFVNVGFVSGGKSYNWTFDYYDCDDFYDGVLDLARDVFDDGYYETRIEVLRGWYIKPEALKELKLVTGWRPENLALQDAQSLEDLISARG